MYLSSQRDRYLLNYVDLPLFWLDVPGTLPSLFYQLHKRYPGPAIPGVALLAAPSVISDPRGLPCERPVFAWLAPGDGSGDKRTMLHWRLPASVKAPR